MKEAAKHRDCLVRHTLLLLTAAGYFDCRQIAFRCECLENPRHKKCFLFYAETIYNTLVQRKKNYSIYRVKYLHYD